MKKSFKKMLMVIFAIIMFLGVAPSCGYVQSVAAAATYKNQCFSLTGVEEYKKYNNWAGTYLASASAFVKDYLKGDSTSKAYTVAAKAAKATSKKVAEKRFVDAWNEDTSGQFGVVIIDCHSDDGYGLYDHSGASMVSMSTISQLKYKKISCIVLIACGAGKTNGNSNTSNIATAFAKKFRCPVIAPDGDVIKCNSFGTETWIGHPSSLKEKNGKGWMLYFPDNTGCNPNFIFKLAISNKIGTVYDLLSQYKKVIKVCDGKRYPAYSSNPDYVGTFR